MSLSVLGKIGVVALAFAAGAGLTHLAFGPSTQAPPAVAATPPAPTAAKPTEGELEAAIRRYILSNPEVIQEALVELERRQAEAENQARARVLQDKASPLYAAENHTIVGNPEGDVTLVEFSDYNCGFCKRGLADVQKLVDSDKKLKVVLKEFPILAPGSVEASRIGLGLREQFDREKLWQFHVKLMAVRGTVGRDQALGVAKELGADLARLEADAAKPAVTEALGKTRQVADQLGLTGTPTFIIGDEVVVGAVGYDAIKQRIEAMRRCGKANCG